MGIEYGGSIWYREAAQAYLEEVRQQNEVLKKISASLEAIAAHYQ